MLFLAAQPTPFARASSWSQTSSPPAAANDTTGLEVGGLGFLAGAADVGANDANVTIGVANETISLENCVALAKELTAQDFSFFVWRTGTDSPGCYFKK
ncbi:hypothetical protein HK405_008696, partial [Cladochytrium tenue]